MEQTNESRELPTEGDYKDLKGKLLAGDLSFDLINKKLMEFDQATPTRDAADENIKFLYDPELLQYIQEHPETTGSYKDILGFTEFHVAQRLAIAGSIEEAVKHFKKSLENAADNNKAWQAYVEGSIMYGEGKEIPLSTIETARGLSQRNADILQHFNAGLSERGKPSYLEDYSK